MATGISLSIDERLLLRTVKETEARFNAVAVTITDPGEGEVIVSKRPKLPSERANRRQGRAGKKAVHGRLIAYELQRRGKDPFRYPQAVRWQAISYLQLNFERAVLQAFRTNKQQRKGVSQVMLNAAMILAFGATENIKKGGLGNNSGNYRKRKPRLVRHITGKYEQRPYGWLSGRFIGEYPGAPGIRARHRNMSRRSPNTRRPKRLPRNVYTR
jgi:hypothetical protein